jgi:hypothetical protein
MTALPKSDVILLGLSQEGDIVRPVQFDRAIRDRVLFGVLEEVSTRLVDVVLKRVSGWQAFARLLGEAVHARSRAKRVDNLPCVRCQRGNGVAVIEKSEWS